MKAKHKNPYWCRFDPKCPACVEREEVKKNAKAHFDNIHKCSKCLLRRYTRLVNRRSNGTGKNGTPENPHYQYQLYIYCAKCKHYSHYYWDKDP